MKYFRKSDFIFTLVIALIEVCLLVLYFSLALFINKHRRQMGEIIFKERIATRRQTDSFNWQTLYTRSPVYEFDTIRTSDAAEAEILFLDGTKLDLLENTLVKLQGLDDEYFADIESGSVSVEAGSSGKNISLAGKVISLFESAKLSLSNIAGVTNVEVYEGEASILENGKQLVLSTLQKIMFAEDGKPSEVQTVERKKIPTKRNQKLVTFEKNTPVVFSFVAENANDAKVVLSRDKKFKKIYKTLSEFVQDANDKNLFSAKENIDLNKVYWKVVYSNGEESEVQSVSIQQVKKLAGSQVQAHSKVISDGENQKIKFTWETIEDATSYTFEIADTKDFSEPLVKQTTRNSSTQVSDLDDGNYYWRVTPNYSGELIDDEQSIVRTLQVKKIPNTLPLKINYPINGYKFNVLSKKDFSFSWERRKNVEAYELSFYREGEESASEIFSASANTVKFSSLTTNLFADVGNVYWTVSYKTKDGKESPLSQKMRIQKTQDDFVFRTIFPKEHYSIAESLMQNIRFTWKDDSGANTNFVIATDEAMQNVVYKKTSNTTSALGMYLGAGDYYWCVQKLDTKNKVTETTEVKPFRVIKNLSAVNFVSPQENTIVPLLNNPHVKIQWNALEAADYYEVAVFEPKGKRILFSPYAQAEPIDIPVGKYSEGTYRISVQAFGLDTMEHTKNIGLKSLLTFEAQKINVAVLQSPSHKTNVSGITAYNKGVRFSWKSHEKLENQELVLQKNNKVVKTISVSEHGSVSTLVPELESGSYTWFVRGKFFGISARSNEQYAFTVSPIPPLATPNFIEKEMQKKVDAAFLEKKRTLHFAWQASASANYYALTITNANKKEVFRKNIYGTNYEFKSLDALSRGNFTANVKAVSTSQLRGKKTESASDTFSFTIDLPKIQKPMNEVGDEKDYYGY